ncbi:MAG TPA: cadherin-like beta sandwich domain-containing protein [Erysipelotrichaceae bacterium]|nr:cadherin-like beta sandwich domain-containing protein [Erysipelotrichaceae bacterium]HQB31941.1 cadherin-like beta sandwich domain-containing protein [Erysipelotrichaceae bacterium]
MKKIVLILLSILCSLSLLTVSAANDYSAMTIKGSTSSICNGLAFVEVNANSQSGVKNITGQIKYDKSVLAVFDVEISDNLDGWEFNIDTTSAGIISFTGVAKAHDPIEAERLLFKVTFIVHGSFETNTVVSTSSVTSEIVEITTEQYITNQAEIDAARQAWENGEEVEIPEPIYGTREVENKRTITFENASHSIRVVKQLSKNSYLKNIEVENGTLSPVFNKLNNAYKVTIDENTELKIDCFKEDERATIVIQDEVNNQVIITVTAEDGSNNTYVLTIIRQANYNSNVDPNIQNPDNPVQPGNNGTSSRKPNAGLDTLSTVIIVALMIVSLVGIGFGGSLIYKGSRE